MRTTLVIDDAVFRAAKVRAAQTGQTLSDMVTRLLETALRAPEPPRPEPFHMLTFGEGEPPVHHEPAEMKALLEDEDLESLRRS